MASTNFKDPGIYSADYEVIKNVNLSTISVGSLNTLKDFQEKHEYVFFTPALPYAWAYEQHLGFDPLFSDLPEKFRENIKQLSLLPIDIVDGFYGNQAYWNRVLWVIPASMWEKFCFLIGGKGFYAHKQNLVVFFSVGLCNGEDVLAKVKGKRPEWIPVAHIDVHTNQYSLVMSESSDTTTLSVAKLPPDQNIASFAAKFLSEDDSAVKLLPGKQKRKDPVIITPDTVSISELSASQRNHFTELRDYYRQIFDNREGAPNE